MKQLFLFLTLVLSLNVFSQEQPVISNSERIIDKYIDKTTEGFTNLIDEAMPLAQQGFEISIKYVYAQGISILTVVLLTFFMCFLTYKEYMRVKKEIKESGSRYGPYDEDNVTFFLIILSILSTLLLIGSLILLPMGVSYIIAPEWHAIQEISELIK